MSQSKLSWETAGHADISPRAPGPNSKTQKQVFVGGLNKTITAEDLSTAFSAFGKIALIRVMTKVGGGGRGFAFVRFQKLKSAEAAVAQQSIRIRSLMLQIKPCLDVVESEAFKQHKAAAKIFVGGLTQKLQKDDILKYLSQFGEISELNYVSDPETGKPKGYCFCVFKYQESADRVLSQKEPHLIGLSKVKVARAVHKFEDQESSESDSGPSLISLPKLRPSIYLDKLNHEADNLVFRMQAPSAPGSSAVPFPHNSHFLRLAAAAH